MQCSKPLLVATLLAAVLASEASAARTVADFRYFRALSVDLNGRIPSRAEVAAFEQDSFDLDGWIEQRLAGPGFAERVRRIYMDLMRLEVGPAFQFVQNTTLLRRLTVKGPDGKDLDVYYRVGQRRARAETDASFCFTEAESGLQFHGTQPPIGTPTPIEQAVLDKNTVLIKPWWLYRDYKVASPSQRYDPAGWATLAPGFTPAPQLLSNPDGSPTLEIRVCNEEAQFSPTGTVYASGRTTRPAMGTLPPAGRIDFPPLDGQFAQKNVGKPIACNTQTAFSASIDCGCGVGLERCLPGAGSSFDPPGFVVQSRFPMGQDLPLDAGFTQSQSEWSRLWWGQEAVHFLDYVLAQDRDFREVLSGHYTVVNGPLAQFYRDIAPANCCGPGVGFDYIAPELLLDPAQLPPDLMPHDVNSWRVVQDRGAHASGLLTMPAFLIKFGTRRARAHVLWQAFACKDFIAGKIQLMPSTEPDLTKRPGCNICHATLEPLSAYFARIQESNWLYLPPANFPVEEPKCAAADPTKMSYGCSTYYDPAFTTAQTSKLRGAYSSEANADAGPAAFAEYLTSTSQFQSCVAQNVASSFIGRALTPDDAELQQQLADVFTTGGYKMRALVRALVKSDAYKNANNLSSGALRDGGAL